jgi:hypothetical protein
MASPRPVSRMIMSDEHATDDRSEEQLAELLGWLPPPPRGWSQAAVDLPAARAALDDLVARALADRAARDAMLADLESAVRAAGVEPAPAVLAEVRARLAAVSREPGSSGA